MRNPKPICSCPKQGEYMAHDETASTSKWTMEAKSFLEVHRQLPVSKTPPK